MAVARVLGNLPLRTMDWEIGRSKTVKSRATSTGTTMVLNSPITHSRPPMLVAIIRTRQIQAADSRTAYGTSVCAFSRTPMGRSEEHTSELQSRGHLVCRLLL